MNSAQRCAHSSYLILDQLDTGQNQEKLTFLFSLLQSWALNKSQESIVSGHMNCWFHGATRIWNCNVFFLEDQCSYCAGAQVHNHNLCVLCCSWELKILKVAFFHARNDISNTRRQLLVVCHNFETEFSYAGSWFDKTRQCLGLLCLYLLIQCHWFFASNIAIGYFRCSSTPLPK